MNVDHWPEEKYDLIVVDPPWNVRKLTHRARPKQTKMDYKTMDLEDIGNLEVRSISSKSCWCFLWTTQKFLFQAPKIIEGWGFRHLLTMVWEKTYGRSAGMPLYGFRWNAEFILVGRRGKTPTWPKKKLIPAVFSAENIRHSQKPDLFYEMVEPLGKRRVDLFARKEREGWETWGNEVSGGVTDAV